jgi:spoIIIJ-associated protein
VSDEALVLAKVRIEELLSFFGINADVDARLVEDVIELDVEDGDGRLIGHRGENLNALQHLVNMMVRAASPERVFVRLDIAGYNRARNESLAAKANEEADLVAQTGSEKIMRPMTPAERRIVHMALSERNDIFTESTGADPRRRVVIKKRAKD